MTRSQGSQPELVGVAAARIGDVRLALRTASVQRFPLLAWRTQRPFIFLPRADWVTSTVSLAGSEMVSVSLIVVPETDSLIRDSKGVVARGRGSGVEAITWVTTSDRDPA